MKNILTEVYFGLKSLFIGMRITLGQFFKPTITVHYPYETLKIPPRFRGHIELVRDPSTGKPKCFVCKLCEKACPSDCITVEGVKPEGAKRKTVTNYRLDFTKCSLCGSCVEACRDGAIRFSREYNLASTSKEEFIMDLFQRLEAERNRTGQNETLDTPESSQAKPNAQAPRGLDQTTVSEPKVIPAAGAPKVEAT
ncbi:MAG TPA: NADH-quinone oxidoreductase subunit I [Candidatus Limnocylindrales bacterium]|jgi:NADH-quinone oxidoreductase subunit I|nr:NADH-quinone oxidoreductase subunit I [Candidatus Limnocylindrales bacterium]